ncbi:MAG: hypothetical protein EBZ89_05450 [Chloroflexi bacterium]|nr:hypothetical protein [Chloroflexota bacterium]
MVLDVLPQVGGLQVIALPDVPAEVPGADTANSPSPVVLQNREFHASILEGRPPSISPDSVLPAMEVLQIAQDAADALAPR